MYGNALGKKVGLLFGPPMLLSKGEEEEEEDEERSSTAGSGGKISMVTPDDAAADAARPQANKANRLREAAMMETAREG